MQQPATVLLVDDDATTNYLNEQVLKSLDLFDNILVASHGQEALGTLAHLCQQPQALPVLVLLDVYMPVMDGIAFLEAYQQLPLTQQQTAVVVILASSMHSRDLSRLQELPVAGLVSKPLTREKVDILLSLHFQRPTPLQP